MIAPTMTTSTLNEDYYHTITPCTDFTLFFSDANVAYLFVIFLGEGQVVFRPKCGPVEAAVPLIPANHPALPLPLVRPQQGVLV